MYVDDAAYAWQYAWSKISTICLEEKIEYAWRTIYLWKLISVQWWLLKWMQHYVWRLRMPFKNKWINLLIYEVYCQEMERQKMVWNECIWLTEWIALFYSQMFRSPIFLKVDTLGALGGAPSGRALGTGLRHEAYEVHLRNWVQRYWI